MSGPLGTRAAQSGTAGTGSFPRQQARTSNFSLGAPRSFQVSPDGRRIVFLRSQGGTDPVTCLWAVDLPAAADEQSDVQADVQAQGPDAPAPVPLTGRERLVADPALLGFSGQEEPREERDRRERSRERAGGVVAFAVDQDFSLAAFALAGDLYVAELAPGGSGPRRVTARSPAIDPRPDPAGTRVAYVHKGALRITDLVSGEDSELIGPSAAEAGHVTYGLAEFVAAEEMGRSRGYWWAPDGSALLVARVDNSVVWRWHIADPANPASPPAEVSYPAAGTPNALVGLLIVNTDGTTAPVRWDAGAYPYLVTVNWATAGNGGEALVVVQSRDQRRMRLLAVDRGTGAATVLREDTDACWLDIVRGVPGRLTDGRIVWPADAEGARRLVVASAAELAGGSARPVTPPGLQVREVLSVDDDGVLFAASADDPAEIGAWTYGRDGLAMLTGVPLGDAGPSRRPQPAGVQAGTRAGGTTVLTSRSMAEPGVSTTVLRGQRAVAMIPSLAERPALPALRVELLRAGPRDIRTALVLPSWYEPGSAKLPVLMDPYGGPHAQRVLASADAYLTSQWFAEQGFAVIVADGRGTPGRGPDWERAVAGDLAGPVLEDQVDALAAVARHCADHDRAELDLTKVAIRGWSFGGYLAALAVLRRPDVFGAAVAGAPVTDWRLYDTHYTERYLGDPTSNADAYERTCLLADAPKLVRPLLLIHGLADDNVVVAHTLRLSSALLAAGRPHSVLPLSGVTHMASREEVAENLLLLQLDFLRNALGL